MSFVSLLSSPRAAHRPEVVLATDESKTHLVSPQRSQGTLHFSQCQVEIIYLFTYVYTYRIYIYIIYTYTYVTLIYIYIYMYVCLSIQKHSILDVPCVYKTSLAGRSACLSGQIFGVGSFMALDRIGLQMDPSSLQESKKLVI